jgi:hypothetical protein
LSSIEVTTQPTKTVYTVGDALDTTGLVVTATYSDKTTADVTSSCTLNPLNGATLSTAGSQTVVVSYDSLTTNFAVTVNAAASTSSVYDLVTSTSQLVAGSKYLIATGHGASSSVYVMGAQDGTYRDPVSYTIETADKITASSEMSVLTLGGTSGAWTFTEASGNIIYSTAVKNISSAASPTAGTKTWSVSINSSSHISTITNTTTAYGSIQYNATSPRFTTYTTSQVAVFLFVQEASSTDTSATDASYWAATFVTTMSGVCANTQANTTASTSLVNAWASQYSAYSSLSSAAKTLVASTTTTDTNIQAAQAKYIYILNKYGTASFTSGNYLGLTISSGAYAGVTKADSSESVAILVVSLMLAAGLAGFYFLRQKKAI